MIKMIETDKSRDVRRGGSRFSRQIKQSGLKLISGLNGVAVGDFVSLEKSSKERIKKLSAVNRAISENYEMGCDIADKEEIQAPSQTPSISGSGTSKRFKLPRKQFFDDCNGVDHVSVPRKLRSAMKKRNRESISPSLPDSKKLNYSTGGAESPKRVVAKKSKLNLKEAAPNWSLKESAGGPITKDEEEVVETLFALAGMFSNNEPDCNNKLDNASSDASPSALPEAGESQPPLEDSIAIKEDLTIICISRTYEDVDPAPEIERSLEETTKVCSLNGLNIQESTDFLRSEKLHGELDSSVAQVNLQKVLVKNEEQKLTCNSASLCFPPGPHQDIGKLNQQAKLEISLLDRKPETAMGRPRTIGNQLDQQHTLDESKNNGPALWPGLSSTVSSSACHGPLSQSCAAKVPAWLGARTGLFQNGSPTGKGSKVSTERRSWKRCSAHVYISRLIQALQMPESKESFPVQQNQLRPHEILKQGVLMTINDFNGITNNLNGVASARTIVTAGEKNSNDNKNGILQHLRPPQDNSQAALASGAYTSHKQSFNFLSLSAGGGGMEPIKNFHGAGNGLEPLAQLHVPYHAQHPTFIPLSMSQTRYTSAYPDQPSAAAVQQAQLQLPSHLSSPYCVPQPSPKAMTKQPQQQQRLWAAQLAAQYRNTGTSTAIAQFPSWQNGRQDSPVLMACIPPSPTTVEVLGPKYPQISHQQHQQQQFMAITLPHARAKRQDHHVSSVYEETGVGFRAGGGALPLQLLCNERL